MKGKTLCIVIALLVLSISAIIGAREPLDILGIFPSTLNGVSIRMVLTTEEWPVDTKPIETLRVRDLDLWTGLSDEPDYVGQFVRFTGVVESVKTGSRTGKVRWLTLEGDTTDVYLPESGGFPESPKSYKLGHKYEFTGFLTRYEAHAAYKKSGYAKLRVYAFRIEYVGESD